MGLIRILKPGLFFYECFKITLLLFFIISLSETPAIFSLVFTTPAVLFPLMALFIWLDISRYKVYLPLYLAGKCIGIVTLALWLIITSQSTMATITAVQFFIFNMILLSGDFFSLAAVLVIYKNVKKLTQTPEDV